MLDENKRVNCRNYIIAALKYIIIIKTRKISVYKIKYKIEAFFSLITKKESTQNIFFSSGFLFLNLDIC